MIKELVKDEAILSTPCEPATAADAEIAQDLVDTLLSIEDAACLAANQIGVTKAICALADDEGNTLVMYNPKVLFDLFGRASMDHIPVTGAHNGHVRDGEELLHVVEGGCGAGAAGLKLSTSGAPALPLE